MWFIYTMEYYSAKKKKKNKIIPFPLNTSSSDEEKKHNAGTSLAVQWLRHFHCRRCRFDPWLGKWDPTRKKKKTHNGMNFFPLLFSDSSLCQIWPWTIRRESVEEGYSLKKYVDSSQQSLHWQETKGIQFLAVSSKIRASPWFYFLEVGLSLSFYGIFFPRKKR